MLSFLLSPTTSTVPLQAKSIALCEHPISASSCILWLSFSPLYAITHSTSHSRIFLPRTPQRLASRLLIALQSLVILDVKPWDDETDMAELEKSVRSIEQAGLVWGSSKLVAIGYGVKKLQITLVIEDELVSLEDLQDEIAEFEDYVQSTDVEAMQSMFHSFVMSLQYTHFFRTVSFSARVFACTSTVSNPETTDPRETTDPHILPLEDFPLTPFPCTFPL